MTWEPIQGIDDGMAFNDDGSPVSGEELRRRMALWEEVNKLPDEDEEEPATSKG